MKMEGQATFRLLLDLVTVKPYDMPWIRRLVAMHPQMLSQWRNPDWHNWTLLYHSLRCTSELSDLFLFLLQSDPSVARSQTISYRTDKDRTFMLMRDGTVTKHVLVSKEQARLLIDYGAQFLAAEDCGPDDEIARYYLAHVKSVRARCSAMVALYLAFYRHKGMPIDVVRLVLARLKLASPAEWREIKRQCK